MSKTTEYEEGRKAYTQGITNNPYEGIDNEKANEWEEGWIEAMGDDPEWIDSALR